MENGRFCDPNVGAVKRAIDYLVDHGGIEVTPLIWIHPEHPECMTIAPDGQLMREFSRRSALLRREKMWRGFRSPSVFHNDPNWPALSTLLPSPPSIDAGCSRFYRRPVT